MDENLNSMEANFAWGHYAIARCSGGTADGGDADRQGAVGETSVVVPGTAGPAGIGTENAQFTMHETSVVIQGQRVQQELVLNMGEQY